MPGKEEGVVHRKNGRGKWLCRVTSAWSWAALLLVAVATLSATLGTASADSPTGSISGTAVAASSGAIEGAVVFANDFHTGETAGNPATTLANGDYTITGLPDGEYRVQVNATAQGFPLQYYDGAPDADGAAAVPVQSGGNTPNIDFSLSDGGFISGTVVRTSDGQPVVDADVWAETYECCGGGNGARTDAGGAYTIQGLAAGDYRVQAHAPEQGLAGEFYSSTADWSLAIRVAVTVGVTTTDIDFSLETVGSIAGSVVEEDAGAQIADAWVWAELYDGGGGRGAS